MAPRILLATQNARWSHTAHGLRSLVANAGALAPLITIREFVLSDPPERVARAILDEEPDLVGLGVYIWNVSTLTQTLSCLRQARPTLPLLLGGPEVSHPPDLPALCGEADAVIAGEAELLFPKVARALLEGERPGGQVFMAEPPPLERLRLPYPLYADQDLAHRNLYVEASRGCPFACDFCLSSLDHGARRFQEDSLLRELELLHRRGARTFRFLDRALHLGVGERLLRWFLERAHDGLFLHFELVPDHLPSPLRALLPAFPAGSIQFELGVQSLDPEVTRRIRRVQDPRKVEETLRFLREETGVHVHADLVAGLPGEDLQGFARGFDRLLALGPQEIQVGILKRLRGAPIDRHTRSWELRWNPDPPYDILSTSHLGASELLRIKAFSQLWDRLANSGRFRSSLPLLWAGESPFHRFMSLSDDIVAREGRSWGIPEDALALHLHEALVARSGLSAEHAARSLIGDYRRMGRSAVPAFLRPYLRPGDLPARASSGSSLPLRQGRHLGEPE